MVSWSTDVLNNYWWWWWFGEVEKGGPRIQEAYEHVVFIRAVLTQWSIHISVSVTGQALILNANWTPSSLKLMKHPASNSCGHEGYGCCGFLNYSCLLCLTWSFREVVWGNARVPEIRTTTIPNAVAINTWRCHINTVLWIVQTTYTPEIRVTKHMIKGRHMEIYVTFDRRIISGYFHWSAVS